MILIDKPYLSDFLIKTLVKNAYPVVKTKEALTLTQDPHINWIDESMAVTLMKQDPNQKIFSPSENAIGWIATHLNFTNLPEKIELFKNKIKNRKLIKPLYPNFYFKEILASEIDQLKIENIPVPCVIKPNVGFFSLAVHKVNSANEWPVIKEKIKADLTKIKDLFPKQVLNTTSFIIEECICGKEYAMDAYYNDQGQAVILNILEHTFSSDKDVSDRVYMSSKKIIQDHLEPFTDFLNKVGSLANIKNFPLHVEVRLDEENNISPIEFNPMRFGGFCTTADHAHYAYGLNAYETYLKNEKPDWNTLLENKGDEIDSLIVLDNSTGYAATQIKSFDYDNLLTKFSHPLDLRKMDYHNYPVFGFLFVKTEKENQSELDYILGSDLSEFVVSSKGRQGVRF